MSERLAPVPLNDILYSHKRKSNTSISLYNQINRKITDIVVFGCKFKLEFGYNLAFYVTVRPFISVKVSLLICFDNLIVLKFY